MANKVSKKTVEALKHEEARRKNIPTVEFQSVMDKDEQSPIRVALPRGVAGLEGEKAARTRDLDYHRRLHSIPESPGQIDTGITGQVDPLISFMGGFPIHMILFIPFSSSNSELTHKKVCPIVHQTHEKV